ncbi:DUF4124 domain-containing protein [Thaumasiovibrio sp. DFM-14]|uniref:DUF4124 domain-containing protein n=1 Tax=Thaumasiovibrio sp. DFM-14 TaxID=3384792 RepID=UPI00399FEF9F
MRLTLRSMFTVLCLVFTTYSALVSATTVYSWLDSNGQIVFSDTPPENGEFKQRNYIAPRISETPPASLQVSKDHDIVDTIKSEPVLKQPPPSSVLLINPVNEQTVRNALGDIMINAATDAPLVPPYQLQLYLDDRPFGAPSNQLQWLVTNIDRGAYQAHVKLLKDGKIIASSPSVTVYLHRTAKLQTPAVPKLGDPPAKQLK